MQDAGEEEEEDNASTASDTTGGPDFNYILNMALWSLTKERKDELVKQGESKVSGSSCWKGRVCRRQEGWWAFTGAGLEFQWHGNRGRHALWLDTEMLWNHGLDLRFCIYASCESPWCSCGCNYDIAPRWGRSYIRSLMHFLYIYVHTHLIVLHSYHQYHAICFWLYVGVNRYITGLSVLLLHLCWEYI